MLNCSAATKLIDSGEETIDGLIEKLADAGACGDLDVSLFKADAYERFRKQPYTYKDLPIDTMLRTALACSAIQRGDCAALQRVLDGNPEENDQGSGAGGKLCICSTRGPFSIDLLDITARVGNREITSHIAGRGCPEHGKCIVRRSGCWNKSLDLVSVAARRGNRAFLEVWLDLGPGHISYYSASSASTNAHIHNAYLHAVMIGRVQILEFLESKFDRDLAGLRFDGLVAAIKTGRIDAIRWFLDRGALSVTMLEKRISSGRMKPLLFTVLQDCNRKLRRWEIMRLLLDTGQIDVNETRPSSLESILWRAMKQKNSSIAMLLLDHGAIVDSEALQLERTCGGTGCRWFESGKSVRHHHWTTWRVSLLWLALELDSNELLERLLAKGMRRSYCFKNKLYRLKQDPDQIKSIEKCLVDLGLDEAFVREEPLKYFILDTDGPTGIRNT